MTAFTGDETALAFYDDLRSFASIFKTSTYVVVTLISDAFIVCLLVSNRVQPTSLLAGISHIHRMGSQLLGCAPSIPTFHR